MENMSLEERLDAVHRSLEDAMIGGHKPNSRTCMKALDLCMSDVNELLMEPMHADPQWVAGLNNIKQQIKYLMRLLDRFLDSGVSVICPPLLARGCSTSDWALLILTMSTLMTHAGIPVWPAWRIEGNC